LYKKLHVGTFMPVCVQVIWRTKKDSFMDCYSCWTDI